MLDRATTPHKEIFTAIMLLTVMQFHILQSSANIREIFKGTVAFMQLHICITMQMQGLRVDIHVDKKSRSWDTSSINQIV